MRISTLGRFTVSHDGTVRTPTGINAQALKVLVCGGRELHWEQLVEQLWPSVDPRRGRVRLRNVLSRLRGQAGPVVARRGPLVVVPAAIAIDAEEFESLAQRALEAPAGESGLELAREALQLYQGDLLPGDRYAEWALQLRDRLRRRFRALVELLVADAKARGELEAALLLLERALSVEPDDEDLALDTAEALAALGRRGAALRLLERVRDDLRVNGLPVSPRWTALHRRLGRAGGPD